MFSGLISLAYPGDICRGHHGIVGVVNDKSRSAACRLFQFFAQRVVDFDLRRVMGFGKMCREPSGLLKRAVWQFFSLPAYDDMRAGNIIGVKPPVVRPCHVESDFFILIIILSHVDIKAVGGNKVERAGLLGTLLPGGTVLPDISVFDELCPDFIQIGFVTRRVQRFRDTLEMTYVFLCIPDSFRQCLCRSLQSGQNIFLRSPQA